MKKIVALLLVFVMLMPFGVLAEETKPPFKILVDGVEMTFPDQQVYIVSQKRLYVPIRPFYEFFGFEVSWNEETQTAKAVKGDKIVELPVGSKDKYYVNGKAKTVDVEIQMKNDRTTMTTVNLIQTIDGYVMRWDDYEDILYIESAENYTDKFFYTQGTHDKANGTREEYNEYYSMSEKAFIMPGLNEWVIPQGITYRKEKDCFYVTGYFWRSMRKSVVFEIDAKSGVCTGQFELLAVDGSANYGHVGGCASTEKDLYLTNGQKLHRIPWTDIDALKGKGEVKVVQDIQLKHEKKSGNSFVDYMDGYLWTGNYHKDGDSSYDKPFSDKYKTVIRQYKVDVKEESGFSADSKIENAEPCEYAPTVMYAVEEQMIQGMTTTKDHIILAQSSGTAHSKIFVYEKPKADKAPDDKILYGTKEVPVYKLTPVKTVTLMPRIEEVVVVDGYLYANFESGAMIYRPNSKGANTEAIWKTDLNKLLEY